MVECLKEAFRRSFHTEIPGQMLLEPDLVRIHTRTHDSILYGTPIAFKRPYLFQSEIEQFLNEAPLDYVIVGFWGHSEINYCFYYCRVYSWSRIFFRLPYHVSWAKGLHYNDYIRDFLTDYFAFEAEILDRINHFSAIETMGAGLYELILNDGTVKNYNRSLFMNPSFHKALLS